MVRDQSEMTVGPPVGPLTFSYTIVVELVADIPPLNGGNLGNMGVADSSPIFSGHGLGTITG